MGTVQKIPRIPYGAWVQDQAHGNVPSFFLADQLTPAGVDLVGANVPRIGEQVALKLLVENETRVLSLKGQVVRHHNSIGGTPTFSVQFTQLNPSKRAFLQQLASENLM